MSRTAKLGFSLIEVLFAVTFLIMVGLATTALNTAVLKVIVNNEITTTASVLNDESLAFVALERKVRAKGTTPGNGDFLTFIEKSNCHQTTGCFVSCPVADLSQSCSLEKNAVPVVLGRSRLRYTQAVTIVLVGSGFSIKTTTRWGNGARDQATAHQFID